MNTCKASLYAEEQRAIDFGFQQLSPDAKVSFVLFLSYHESGIAEDINDFGELRIIFTELFGRAPKND